MRQKFGYIQFFTCILTILIEFSFLIDFFSMKEFRGGIIRLFEQAKNANQQEKMQSRRNSQLGQRHLPGVHRR